MKANSWTFRALEYYGTKLHHRGQWRIHQWLRKVLKADVNCELEVKRGNLQWMLNPSDFVQTELFWTGGMDAWDTQHVLKMLKPGDTLFDVGANFGYYSMIACAELASHCTVYAFEPNAPSYARLEKNIQLNHFADHIKAIPLALSDACGESWIVERPGNTGDARLDPAQGDRRVAMTTMDEFCLSHHVERVDFIKIDVQGYEEKVLLGGKKTIASFSPAMLMELDTPILRAQGSTEDRVIKLVLGYGYKLFVAVRDKLVPFHPPWKGDLVNIFCLQEKHFRRE